MTVASIRNGSAFSTKELGSVKEAESFLPACLQKLANRICRACESVFAYFGSKDGSFFSKLYNTLFTSLEKGKEVVKASDSSGYERHPRRTLEKSELLQCAALCSMTAFVHNHEAKFIEPIGIKSVDIGPQLSDETVKKLTQIGFEFKDGVLFHVKNCVKMTLLQAPTGKYYLGFGDAGALPRFGRDHALGDRVRGGETRARITAAKELALGKVDFLECTAKATSLLVKALNMDPSQVTLIGQCYGGMLASYSAIKLGFKCVTMNSVSLGAHAQVRLGERLSKAKELVTHIFVEGDWTQSHPIVDGGDWLFSRLGFRTPGCFGKKFEIKNIHGLDLIKKHLFSLDLVLGGLGYPKRQLIENMTEEQKLQIQESNFDAITELQ